MPKITISIVLLAIFVLIFSACSSNQPQYVDSRNFVSFGLDNHDIGDMIQNQADSLLSQNIIKNQTEPKFLTIGAIENDTTQNIDIEEIVTMLIKHLGGSGKFQIVNAGRNEKIEKLIKESRKMRNNKEYNQYTTIEEGNLIAPEYALTGKITQIDKPIGDDAIVEYSFSLILTNLKLGTTQWASTETIAKKVPKSEVANYRTLKPTNAQDSSQSSYYDTQDSSYDSDSGRKNHFILGADIGIMSLGSMKIEPLALNIGGRSYIISSKGSKSSSSTSSSSESISTYPLSVRMGYLRDIGNWGIGINALYGYTYSKIENKNWDISGSYYSSNISVEGTASLQRIGGEILAFYQPNWEKAKGFNMFLGASVLKDFGSKLNIKVNATNANAIDNKTIVRKIDSLYIMAKLGLIWYFSDFVGFTYELNYSWAISGDNSISTGFGWGVIGLQMRI